MLDPNGHVVTWNAGAERIKGYKAEEIIGQHFTRFYPQEAIDRGWPAHELKVAAAEGRFEDEGWRLRKDGSRFWANVVITALRDERGELRGFSKVTRDLTARKQAEEALRQSEERFRLLVEGAKDYAIFLLDPQGNVASWNAGAERIKGYKAEEIVGQHFSKFYPQEALDRGWPEYELKVARAEGRFEDEGWRVRIDGTQFWANVVITALKDERGSLLGFSKITRDLTARKQAEENARRLAEEAAARRVAEENARLLHEQRERLHVTLTSIGDAVISTDAEGRVEFLNPVAEELLGWKTEEAARHKLDDVFRIVNETTRQPVENPALRALQEGRIVGLANHTVLISKDGTERPIDDSAAPIRDQKGDISGSVLVFRDISERKRSEAALGERVRLLALNAAVGEALVRGDGLAAMLQRCAGAMVDHLHGAFARIWTFNPHEDILELRASAGLYTHLDGPHSRVPVGKYKIGLIAQERKPHLTNAVVGDPRVGDQEWAKREGMVAFAGYPLLVDDRLVGVMAMFARQSLSETTLEAMASVADEIAVGIERKSALERLHEREEWLRVTLASIGDAVITTDTQGRVTFLNGVAQDLTGWTTEDAQGKALEAVFAIRNEKTRQPVENPVERVLREGIVVGLANHTILIAKDGTERPIDDSAAPIRDAAGRMLGVVLIFRDVTEQRRAEHHRNARLAVTHALSEAATVEEGSSAVLRAVCENLGWDVGFFWTVNEEGTALICTKSWHRSDVPVDDFEKASCSRTFEKGQGLPGRVWASGQPAWVLDIAHDGNFPRLAPAVRYGLHSALAHPVVVGDRTLGVIEFFTRRIQEPDTNLLEMMGTVAGNVGQFIERKAAEDELRESERELADFFENASIGLHWVGPNGTILRANRAELDMLGYSREEYVGRPIADFHADQAVICDILQRLQVGERLDDYPARLRCKDGSIKDVLIDSSVLWRDGEFVHTRCFTRDVTERKRAEAKVREQEQQTRTILESITDAFFGLDRDWRFTYVNRQAEALLGRSRDDLIGKSHWDVYPDTLGTVVERSYDHAVAENITVTFENYYPPHDRWYEVRAYPSPDGLAVYFRDVGERKRAEIALRESEQRFRQLADAMPQIVWTARPDGNIDYLNHRWTEFTGLPQTVGNEGWGQILHPDDSRTANERWAASLATGAPFEMEMRLLDRRQQSYRWHLIRTVPVPDGVGKVARWFGTSTDIHEQKRAEESSLFLAEASAELAGVVDYESTLQKVANLAVPYFADWSAVDLADDDGNLRRLAVAHQDPEKIALVHDLVREYPPDPQAHERGLRRPPHRQARIR